MNVISPSLSPNTEADDVQEAIRVLLHPASWQQGTAIYEVERWLMKHLGASSTVSFDSGRSAILAILQAFGIGAGDEVLTQAFTCVAVPNSIRWTGATPVYVDIDGSFNIDPKDLDKKITNRTKAMIVQHTFGVPAQMDAIQSVVKKYGFIVIEDCAHSLGGKYKGHRVGTLGDASFFSFGRDKVISSVWGGVAALNINYQKSNIKNKLEHFHGKLSFPSHYWIAQQLLHPVAFAAVLPTYNMVVGKVLLETLKRIKLLSAPVYEEEKRGDRPSFMPRRYPNALAQLLVKQLAKLERYNDQRRRVASYYHEALVSRNDLMIPRLDREAVYLRFPILVENPAAVMKQAKRQGILLGNWYHHIIDPNGVDLRAQGYRLGSCPRAEEAAAHIVNLPTLITQEEARRVSYAI